MAKKDSFYSNRTPANRVLRKLRKAGSALLSLGGGTTLLCILIFRWWIIPLLGILSPFLVMAAIGGLILMIQGSVSDKKGRYRQYQEILARQQIVPIDEIATRMGVSYKKAVDDLKDMKEGGWLLPSAVIDETAGCYYADESYRPEPLRRARSEADSAAARPQSAPAQTPTPAPASRPANGKAPGMPEEYARKLREIRQVNDAIRNETMSAQIERIEEITRRIFELVQNHPEKEKQIHTFLNYYLPTTLKLLTSYSELEKQPITRGNIAESRERIERLMEQMEWAFGQQLDQLFEEDAQKIDTEIRVMKQMMEKDGLAEGKLPRDPFGLHGGAAAQKKPGV